MLRIAFDSDKGLTLIFQLNLWVTEALDWLPETEVPVDVPAYR